MSNGDGGMSAVRKEYDDNTWTGPAKVISSFCADKPQCCVEVEALPSGDVAVSDSKTDTNEALVYTRDEWDAFVDGVKDGDFDYDRLVEFAPLIGA